ncbi:hypothetical protein ABT354_20155 [Streptomyces sp. NPDC000594]|uniref:hypothetical protein n=1 Tax=Streptomyces sp. NPDC000594 TaxID=3154261 RepID=UPI00331ECB5D
MSLGVRTWGIWHPTGEEIIPPGETGARPLEWWPSARAAGASLRARTPQAPGRRINTDTEHRADGTMTPDAQFYGSLRSVIHLYAVEGEPGADPRITGGPYAVLGFGPRGGIRHRPFPAATPGTKGADDDDEPATATDVPVPGSHGALSEVCAMVC